MFRWGENAPRTVSRAPIDRGGTTDPERERSDPDGSRIDGDGSRADDVGSRPGGGDSRTEGPRLTRRESLRGIGALGALGAARDLEIAERETGAASQDGSDGSRGDFLWLGSSQWREPRLRENVLALAARHDLTMVYGQPPSNMPGVGETVRPALEAAVEFGVEPWFNAGVLRDLTPERFANDADERERHLDGLREVATAFDDLVDGGRIVLWQEAPVMGRWSENGEWNREAVENLLEHGPSIFEAQRAAVTEANPDLDVGIFVHFPYVVDSKQPEVFADLVDRLRERDATPDFGFADFYPGWYEKDVGLDPACEAIRSLVSNAREHLGREVFYMSQPHTINPGHTPSGQSIRAYVRTALDVETAGLGWYPAGGYDATESGFDPLVPNPADATLADGPVSTVTVSRDRYQYAVVAALATRDDVDPAGRFDLWLHGDGFPFYAHRVEARTADDEWALLGDAGGYLGGDHPYADNRTTAFRALDRERFLDGGALELRVRTRDADGDLDGGLSGSVGPNVTDSDDAPVLETAVAMPWDPTEFFTEGEATRLLTGDAPLGAFELGRASPGAELSAGESVRVTVPVTDGVDSLTPLAHPDRADAVERLAAAEDREDVDPSARFDLWLAGSGLANPDAAPALRDADDERVHPTDASLVAVSNDDAALYYGLARERFLDGGLELVGGEATVDAAYAMPYAGSECFRSPARARELLDDEPEEVATYALAEAET